MDATISMFYMGLEDQTQVIRISHMDTSPISHLIALDMIFLKQYFVYIHAHMTDERCTHIGSVLTGSR